MKIKELYLLLLKIKLNNKYPFITGVEVAVNNHGAALQVRCAIDVLSGVEHVPGLVT